ncbi:hypothetical protein SAMN04489740_3102 [Arthrobacter alpinus]|uniref:Uncharacterized protein n=1 Tax=Arthrobacter alpinus TaxID=656366 RepID=A0A1H5MUK5_9MICC|nr:hypothetical protein [Arthrobacter alpinus]SEE92048.1 hypothetical protein SAMN04489740_3102 [Arthrobacter alpinus]
MERINAQGQGGGLTLLQVSEDSAATLGEVVTFTSYILNEGTQALLDVRLVPVSLNNAAMAHLSYINRFKEEELTTAALLPGAYVKWNFQYQIALPDIAAGGPIVSAMSATATAHDGAYLRAESDVVITVSEAS